MPFSDLFTRHHPILAKPVPTAGSDPMQNAGGNLLWGEALIASKIEAGTKGSAQEEKIFALSRDIITFLKNHSPAEPAMPSKAEKPANGDYYEQLKAFTRSYPPLCEKMGGNVCEQDVVAITYHAVRQMAEAVLAKAHAPLTFDPSQRQVVANELTENIREKSITAVEQFERQGLFASIHASHSFDNSMPSVTPLPAEELMRRAKLITQCLQTPPSAPGVLGNNYEIFSHQILQSLPGGRTAPKNEEKALHILNEAISNCAQAVSINGDYKAMISEMHDNPGALKHMLDPHIEQAITIEKRIQWVFGILHCEDSRYPKKDMMQELRQYTGTLVRSDEVEAVLAKGVQNYVLLETRAENWNEVMFLHPAELANQVACTIAIQVKSEAQKKQPIPGRSLQ